MEPFATYSIPSTFMDFRTWCSNKWYEHCDEVLAYTGNAVPYSSETYFGQYKYWLKREYLFQKNAKK